MFFLQEENIYLIEKNSKVKYIILMFYYSPNLEYINLNNFNESKLSEDNDGYYYQNI